MSWYGCPQVQDARFVSLVNAVQQMGFFEIWGWSTEFQPVNTIFREIYGYLDPSCSPVSCIEMLSFVLTPVAGLGREGGVGNISQTMDISKMTITNQRGRYLYVYI